MPRKQNPRTVVALCWKTVVYKAEMIYCLQFLCSCFSILQWVLAPSVYLATNLLHAECYRFTDKSWQQLQTKAHSKMFQVKSPAEVAEPKIFFLHQIYLSTISVTTAHNPKSITSSYNDLLALK